MTDLPYKKEADARERAEAVCVRLVNESGYPDETGSTRELLEAGEVNALGNCLSLIRAMKPGPE